MKFTQSGTNNYSPTNETIPSGFRPTAFNTPIQCGNADFCMLIAIDGKVTMLGDPANKYTPMNGSWITTDSL